MMVASRSPTADEILQRREELKDQGITVVAEELLRGASEAVRDEVAARLSLIEAAEKAVEFACSWAGAGPAAGPFEPLGVAGRYEAPRIWAGGGMGVVCSARDVEPRPDCGLQGHAPEHRNDRRAVDRFFHEAEITSRLDHPGVVPVLGRVTDDSGLPAYASAFVPGRTLASKIEEYRKVGPDRPGERAEARAALLRAFLAVCEVVAFAHSRQVVHGDIKPLNVLIDEFGATRLVDWGLARDVSSGEPESVEEDEVIRPGTPVFLSSFGRPATSASDIYSLGLTLALILADPPTAPEYRLHRSADVPPALWAVASKARHPDRPSRYPSASAMAEDVRAVLADRPVEVHRDPLATRLRRWSARHRPAVVTTAALLAVAAVAGPIVGVRERGLRRQADSERLRAVRLTREMLDQVDHIGRLQATLPGSREMLDRAVVLIEQLARDAEAQGLDLAPAAQSFYRAGRIHLVLGRLDGAARCFLKAADLAERSDPRRPGAESDEAGRLRAEATRDWGVVQAMLGRSADADAAWKEALGRLGTEAPRTPGLRLARGRLLLALGNARMLAGHLAAARSRFAQAQDMLAPLALASPREPKSVKPMADVLTNLGYGLYLQAVPDGSHLADPARLAESRQALAEGLRLRRSLAQIEPGDPEHLADIAASLNHLGNAAQVEGEAGFDAASASYREAETLLRGLILAYPSVQGQRRELAQVHSNLNVLLASRGKADEAKSSAEAAVETFRQLARDRPDSPDALAELGIALTQQARTLRLLKNDAGASAASYEAAVWLAKAASLSGEPRRRETFAGQAVALLGELGLQGYFRRPQATERLAAEPAFAEIRLRPGFPGP